MSFLLTVPIRPKRSPILLPQRHSALRPARTTPQDGALDGQLQRDAGVSHFEDMVLAMLSEAPDHTLRMTALAAQTKSTLPRLSHVVTRLVNRGFVERIPCPQDKRATNAHLTDAGWQHIRASAPGHVAAVRELVVNSLSAAQIGQLRDISANILARLDPEDRFSPKA